MYKKHANEGRAGGVGNPADRPSHENPVYGAARAPAALPFVTAVYKPGNDNPTVDNVNTGTADSHYERD